MFSDKLRSAMIGRTVAEVSRLTGLNRQQIHRYLNGCALPRADAYIKLCVALQLDPVATMDQTDYMFAGEPRSLAQFHGSVEPPSERQLLSGTYSLFSSWVRSPDKLFRVALRIEPGTCCRRVFVTLPFRHMPSGTPRTYRRLTGCVTVKFDSVIMLTVYNEHPMPNGERQVITVALGSADARTGARNGLSLRVEPSHGNSPIAAKAALRHEPGMTQAQLLRCSRPMHMAEAPSDVAEYFSARSTNPVLMGPAFLDNTSARFRPSSNTIVETLRRELYELTN